MAETATMTQSTDLSAARAGEVALVAELRRRSPQAFEDLVRSHGVTLMATTRRILRDEHEANDALQDALVSAFRAIDGFDGRAPLGAWLQQITVNACLMKLRSKRRRKEIEVDALMPAFNEYGQFAEHQHPWSEASDAPAERAETAALVRKSIDQLPDKFRVPLVLRDLEGIDYEGIAERLGVTVNAAKIRVHRGRQALRALLDPYMRQHLR